MGQRSLASPRNAGIGAVSAPLLLVGIFVMLHHVAEPHSSVADVQPPQDPETIVAGLIGAVSESQQSAMEFCHTLPLLEEESSPFPLMESQGAGIDDLVDPNSVGLEIPMEVIPEFTVTAMIASKSGNIALINGKAQRAGDKLAGGWSIKSIDAAAEVVVVLSPDGEEHTLKIDRSGAMRSSQGVPSGLPRNYQHRH